MNDLELFMPQVNRRSVLLGTLALLALAAAFCMWHYYPLQQPVATDVSEVVTPQPYSGSWYLTAPDLTDADASSTAVYQYNVQTGESVARYNSGSYGLGGEDDTYQFLFGPVTPSVDPDGIEPVWVSTADGNSGSLPHVLGYDKRHMTTDSANRWYAYQFRADSESDPAVFANWASVLIFPDDAVNYTLIAATQPQRTDDGATLMVLRADGLYAYDLATATETLVRTPYDTFSTADEFTVSADGETVVLALADPAQLVLLARNQAGAYEQVAAVSLEVPRGDVTFDPTGQYLAMKVIGTDVSTDEATYFEIRDRALTVQDTLSFPGVSFTDTTLDQWLP